MYLLMFALGYILWAKLIIEFFVDDDFVENHQDTYFIAFFIVANLIYIIIFFAIVNLFNNFDKILSLF